MTKWQLGFYSGSAWSDYYNIENATNVFSLNYTTNQNKVKLYNGDFARTSPSVKYSIADVELEFSYIDEDNNLIKDGVSTKSLESLIKARNKIRIKTHLTDDSSKRYVITGYLSNVEKPWRLGLLPKNGELKTCFDMRCTIDVLEETWV